jgi:RNA-directed DNA polymerase
LPIGNLTSQWLANWYLSDLDYFVTNRRGVGGYVRYCDDFILLDNDRSWLQELVHQVQEFLANKRLRLHQGRLAAVPVRAGLKFVGYRTWSSHRFLPKQNVRQFRRRLSWMKKAYSEGWICSQEIWPRLASWLGHARNVNSHRLIEKLSQDWIFVRCPAIGISSG